MIRISCLLSIVVCAVLSSRSPAGRLRRLFCFLVVLFTVNQVSVFATPIAQIAKLTASDSDPDDVFGWFVDMDAGNAIVGNFPYGPGTAYLYDTTSSFTETILPTPSGTIFDNFYASSVAIYGNTALAGAPGNTDPSSSMPSGGVYTFDVSLGTSTSGKYGPTVNVSADEYGFSLCNLSTGRGIYQIRGALVAAISRPDHRGGAVQP